MEQVKGGEDAFPKGSNVRNELSGQVTGPAIQAGAIHGNVNITMTGPPPVTDATEEAVAEELRRSSQIWRARFSSVDLVNLPRMAMLVQSNAVAAAARKAGLDSTRPFGGQGIAPGEFVRIIRPLFETWNAEAVTLCERTVKKVHRGLLVSFESAMRCSNPPGVPLKEPTGVLSKDPHLTFSIGARRVVITFDPRWLTTSTATTTLHEAAQETLVFSGIGTVASVSKGGQIRISALVFGQPETLVQAEFEYIRKSLIPAPHGLMSADFRNELSRLEKPQICRNQSGERGTVMRKSIALLFDEDEVLPGQIDRDVLTQVSRVVPEYRRDLGVAVAGLFFDGNGVAAADLAAHFLAREPALWKTLTVPGLTTLIKSCNLAVSTVSGLSEEQAVDLDAAMRETVASYLGCVEVDRKLPLHRRLLPERDDYHVADAELRLVYSAARRLLDEANGEDLEAPLNEWRERGLFRSVTWEEDLEQSAAEEKEASMIVHGWLNAQPE
ncbi:hypothetical protein [Streptomyces sudanensis]|uniref:hypothetical protein n=1 Tax=Streptomyces sudanensis TaxID=436397 RepID=UPI0020CBD4B5|nr:hypothetical protein [Streptomyces sudanensis]MCP9958565.1 hypothetical protein [Streptomyces sudanensis]MCQ0000927.1 hypothetical protein [Streptomyces sudanensis]